MIAQAKKTDDGLDIRVHPMLVSKNNPLSDIKNATNAVMLNGFPVDKVMFVGPGAGEFPTASSVVGDILAIKSEIANKGNVLPMTVCRHSEYANQINVDNTKNCYYLSILALSEPGVIGKIGCACAEFNINISCVIQKGINEDNNATIIVITEECFEKDINSMINKLENENKIHVTNRIRVM